MSQRARIALVVVAAAVLVVAFFAARGSEEADDPPVRDAQTQTETQTRTVTQPATTATTEESGGVRAPAQTTTAPAEPDIPVVEVVGGEPEGGVQELDFEEGERVRFRVRSDTADEIHVHGYDETADVGPGNPATFSFEGDLTGQFEVELHGTGTQIASLRVSP